MQTRLHPLHFCNLALRLLTATGLAVMFSFGLRDTLWGWLRAGDKHYRIKACCGREIHVYAEI
jgi:hypothetical protein